VAGAPSARARRKAAAPENSGEPGGAPHTPSAHSPAASSSSSCTTPALVRPRPAVSTHAAQTQIDGVYHDASRASWRCTGYAAYDPSDAVLVFSLRRRTLKFHNRLFA